MPPGQRVRHPGTVAAGGAVGNLVLLKALDVFSADSDSESSARAPTSVDRATSPEVVVAKLFVGCSFVGFTASARLPSYWASNAPAAYVMATVLSHLAPPLAHCGGARQFPSYDLVMVGRGGPKFVRVPRVSPSFGRAGGEERSFARSVARPGVPPSWHGGPPGVVPPSP